MPLDSIGYVPACGEDAPCFAEASQDRQVTRDLVALRELLSDPARWCRGSWALDAHGQSCDPLSLQATSFCLLGGWRKVRRGSPGDALCEMDRIWRVVSRDIPAIVNDSCSHAELMLLIDRAIAQSRAASEVVPK